MTNHSVHYQIPFFLLRGVHDEKHTAAIKILIRKPRESHLHSTQPLHIHKRKPYIKIEGNKRLIKTLLRSVEGANLLDLEILEVLILVSLPLNRFLKIIVSLIFKIYNKKDHYLAPNMREVLQISYDGTQFPESYISITDITSELR